MEKIAQVGIGNTFFGSNTHFLLNLTGLGTLVYLLLSNAIVIAGVVFIFLIVFAGYNMISGAGSNNPQMVAKGSKILGAAVIGFIIVVAAYWIVRIVENATGSNLLG